jgi:hypothetical protein
MESSHLHQAYKSAIRFVNVLSHSVSSRYCSAPSSIKKLYHQKSLGTKRSAVVYSQNSGYQLAASQLKSHDMALLIDEDIVVFNIPMRKLTPGRCRYWSLHARRNFSG